MVEDRSTVVVEFLDLENSDNKDLQQDELQQIESVNVIEPLKIKQENERLRTTIRNLNNRIGTEVVQDEYCVEATPRYPRTVNTLNYQNDLAFGKKIFFITNVN